MKIGIISDTHDHWSNIEKFVDIFLDENVNAIFHCGDIVAPFMKMPFKKLENKNIKLFAVYGNNDGERAGLKKIFGELFDVKGDFFETEFGGKKIVMFHHLSPEMVEALALSGKYDIILKGHTHQQVNKKIGNTLIINPGEGCGYLTQKASVAILDMDKMKAKFIELN